MALITPGRNGRNWRRKGPIEFLSPSPENARMEITLWTALAWTQWTLGLFTLRTGSSSLEVMCYSLAGIGVFFADLCCQNLLCKTTHVKFSWHEHPLCREGPQNIPPPPPEDLVGRRSICQGCGHPTSIASSTRGLLWEITPLCVVWLNPKSRRPHIANE